MVGEVEAEIGGALIGGRSDLLGFASDLAAEVAGLPEREAVGAAAADIPALITVEIHVGDLVGDEVAEIGDVEEVADLLTGAAESDVAEGLAEVMPGDPLRDDTLLRGRHLPGAGQQATAVDDVAEAVGLAVLLDHHLGR